MAREEGCRQAASIWAGHPLRTARLVLRPPEQADAPALVAAGCGEAAADDFLAVEARRRRSGTGLVLVLERVVDRSVIGLAEVEADAGAGLFLTCRIEDGQCRQGYAVEALRRLVRHLFETLGHDRILARIDRADRAAGRVIGRLGFVPEDGGAAPRFVLAREVWRSAHAARPRLLVVAAALVDGDGRVLLTTRPPGKTMAGLWEFPGGKVGEAETPEQALIRELDEELGLDVTESCLAPLAFASHDYDTFHLLMPLYVVRVWRGTPAPREGQGLRWVRAARLGDLPMPPADIPLVAILRDWL